MVSGEAMAELVSATLSDADCTAVYLFHDRVPYSRVTLPDPARAIRDDHHDLEHFEQSRRIGRNSRRSISPAEPLWCRIRALTIHMGNGSVGKDLGKLC